MKKHFLFFSANYLPGIGGVERYTFELANGVVKKGHKVTIVTSNVYKMPEVEESNNIRVIRTPCINVLNGRFPIPLINKTYKTLMQQLAKDSYDFVLVQTRFYILSLIGVLFGKKKKIPTILIEHGTSHFTVNNLVLDKLGHFYEHSITKIVRKNCDHYYGVSSACCRWLKHFNIEPNGVLYNAINLSEIESETTEIDGLAYRNILSENHIPVVLFCGRLVKEKGVLLLIEAIKELNRSGEKVALIIAGDGELYESISLLNDDYIIAAGGLAHEEVLSLMRECDVFCLPTFAEGFSTAVLEAVACKLFVITTDTGGSAELILNDEFGIILNDNTVDEIVKAIRKVVNNKKYKKEAEEKAYERLVNNFTWVQTTEAFLRVVEEIHPN